MDQYDVWQDHRRYSYKDTGPNKQKTLTKETEELKKLRQNMLGQHRKELESITRVQMEFQ